MNRLFHALIGFWLLSTSLLHSQNLQFEQIGISSGLAVENVRSICKDSNGFMWFATQNGLQRYDGYEFTSFLHDASNPTHSISGNEIQIVREDSYGNIWCGTSTNGLDRIEALTKKVTHFNHKNLPEAKNTDNSIVGLAVDKDGNVWFSTHSSVFKITQYKSDTGFVDKIEKISKGHQNSYADIFFDKNGNVWIASISGVFLYNSATKSFHSSKNNPKNLAILNINRAIGTLFLEKDSIWFGTWPSVDEKGQEPYLYKYVITTNSLEKTDIAPSDIDKDYAEVISAILPDKTGNLWIGTLSKGLYVRWKNTNYFENFVPIEGNTRSYIGLGVSDIFEDEFGNIWFASPQGLCKFEPRNQNLPYVQPLKDQSYSEGELVMRHLHSTKDGYLISSNGSGLFSVDKNFSKAKSITERETPKGASSSGNIWAMQYLNGTYYLGVYDGFYLYKRGWNKMIKKEIPAYPNSSITDIVVDSLGRLILSLYSKTTVLYNIQKDSFTILKIPSKESNPMNPSIRDMALDAQGNVWLAIYGEGLRRLNPYTQTYDTILSQFKNEDGIHDFSLVQSVACIDSFLVFGTRARGIGIYNIYSKEFQQITSKNGLPNNSVNCILHYKSNELIIGTDYGIGHLSIGKEGIYCKPYSRNFKEKRVAHLAMDDEGKVLAFGRRGFTRFKPSDISEEALPPAPVITRLQIGDNLIHLDSLKAFSDKIYIPHKQNKLSVTFASLLYSSSTEVQYYYRLKGLENNWNATRSSRTINFSKLEGGNYTLQIKATDISGLWNGEITELAIFVETPIYKRAWFQVLIFVLLVFSTLLVARYRIQQIRKEEVEKTRLSQQMSELEMKALQAQMNPHFIFNCLNSINRFILSNDADNASLYLVRFSSLIRLILENSTKPVVLLSDELKMLSKYMQLESIRLEHGFDFEIDLPQKLKDADLFIPPMIVQPYIENAIWHGLMPKTERGKLHLKIRKQEQNLLVEIKDNGVGREYSTAIGKENKSKHKSMGMEVTKDRLQLLQNSSSKEVQIEIVDLYENKKAAGTLVRLQIPIM